MQQRRGSGRILRASSRIRGGGGAGPYNRVLPQEQARRGAPPALAHASRTPSLTSCGDAVKVHGLAARRSPAHAVVTGELVKTSVVALADGLAMAGVVALSESERLASQSDAYDGLRSADRDTHVGPKLPGGIETSQGRALDESAGDAGGGMPAQSVSSTARDRDGAGDASTVPLR